MSLVASNLHAQAQAQFPVLATIESKASNLLSSVASGISWSPSVDLIETENSYVVLMDLPYVDMNTFKVKVENGMLSVEGNVQVFDVVNREATMRIRERRYVA